MKTITLHLDDDVYKVLQEEAALLSFVKGCVAPPTLMQQIMCNTVLKIEKGAAEMTVTKKG